MLTIVGPKVGVRNKQLTTGYATGLPQDSLLVHGSKYQMQVCLIEKFHYFI